MDLAKLTDQELGELFDQIIAEQGRRQATATYLEETLPPEVLAESSDTENETVPEYSQPTGAHDAYPLGALIVFDGWVYRSLIPANVWTPTGYPRGWHKLEEYAPVETEPETDEPGEPVEDEPTTVPEYTQPTGAHDAYQKGDRVLYDGAIWESLIDANVWSPADYPAGWKKVEQ